MTDRDEYWMQYALDLAVQAEQAGEVPVGAVLVLNDEVVGEGYNRPIGNNDPTAHAEMIALRHAADRVKNYRLPETSLYVTLEPCLMCAGALIHARIKRLVYGAYDKKAGAVVSQAQLLDHSFINHKIEHQGGILADRCSHLLSAFFRARRENKVC